MTEYILTCFECGKVLDPAKAVWLYFDPRTRTYSARQMAKEFERGAWAFDKECAALKKAEHANRKGVAK